MGAVALGWPCGILHRLLQRQDFGALIRYSTVQRSSSAMTVAKEAMGTWMATGRYTTSMGIAAVLLGTLDECVRYARTDSLG